MKNYKRKVTSLYFFWKFIELNETLMISMIFYSMIFIANSNWENLYSFEMIFGQVATTIFWIGYKKPFKNLLFSLEIGWPMQSLFDLKWMKGLSNA